MGQRQVLRLDGELHIDVTHELNDDLPANDARSLNVKLDSADDAGTAKQILLYLKNKATTPGFDPIWKKHAEYLADYYQQSVSLSDGLNRAPALGGGTIRHPRNVRQVETNLGIMLDDFAGGVGGEKEIIFWIASSTAGGTGEGTHRFVGETIAKLLQREHAARVRLKFIRIGPMSYSSVDPERTKLNTFFGVAADAAFHSRLLEEYGDQGLTANWFYVEVPDVGKGAAAKPFRSRLVEMACKGIMLDELSSDIDTIINNDGIGLVSVGYWGQDFDENGKYYVTINQLITQLDELITPNYYGKYVSGNNNPPTFSSTSLEGVAEDLTEDVLIQKMSVHAWKFPKTLTGNPGKAEILAWARECVDDINQLISPRSVGKLNVRVEVSMRLQKKETEDAKQEGSQPSVAKEELRVSGFAAEPHTPEWFDEVELTQNVKAWAFYLLGTGQGTREDDSDWLRKLVMYGQECYKAQNPPWPDSMSKGTRVRARELHNPLVKFITALAYVLRLDELERDADALLGSALVDATKVLKFAEGQELVAKASKRTFQDVPVLASPLDEELERRTTWLMLLDKAARRNDAPLFRKEVLKGATGLEKEGLISILNLDRKLSPDDQQIKKALRQHVGQMVDAEGDVHEAMWWHNSKPLKVNFSFRIFPRLKDTLRAALKDEDQEIKYLYTKMGFIGLYVLAFEGATVNTQSNDLIVTPTYLIRPYIELVRSKLNDWADVPRGRTGSKFDLVCAGVGSEPLFAPALAAAGLTDVELKKLGEFYNLYDPAKRTRNKMAKRA